MLETVREFGLEQLAAAGETDEARRRHAEHFLALAERVALPPFDPGDVAALGWLDRDEDNLRAALEWFQAAGDGARLLRLAGALEDWWFYRGRLEEGERWSDLALRLALPTAPPRLRAWTLKSHALLAQVRGDVDLAVARYAEAIRWWQTAGDPRGRVVTRSFLGGALVGAGRYDEAAEIFEDNLRWFRERGTASGSPTPSSTSA